ncbi:ABC transporter permease [Bifidobacterium sp. DSM 109958]|uniref:ABC transporter permease n=1 Tax=Bifidobacterium moraviense TaxID=2675323 RepID=A0A7Y0F0S1_9BIFI|nr:ECF transporter S component [Bifidobacterium sp. DSM 109958]NMM99893.1 ABC transporter permease [Bifidobacterium sp. DSM 109958]
MSAPTTNVRPNLRWRVVDIAVASVIGVASAIIYFGAALLWGVVGEAMEVVLPGLTGLLNGLWLFAAPLAALIVRKPGAALYAEVVAAVLEALIGTTWGIETLFIGIVQGLFAEIAFAIFAYKVWNLGVASLSGLLTGISCWGYSFFAHLQAINWGGPYGVTNLVTTIVSGVLIAGVAMWYLYVAIAKTGALDKFASGRAVRNAA